MSPDLGGSTVTRTARRQGTSEEQAISSETRRFPRTSRLRRSGDEGLARRTQDHGRRSAAERWCGPSLRGVGTPSTRPTQCFTCWGASHPARGVARSLESCPGGFGRRGMFGPLWSERVRGSEAWKEKALEGRKPRRGSAAGSGQLESARTDSQEDQGFEAGEAGGTERFRGTDPG
jgi:hypothetical protein